jgi:sugar phosphate isomerase/epimerase
MTNRRTFLTQAGLASAGLLMAPSLLKAAAAATGKPGIQLYSLRDLLPKDVKGVIAKVAQAGFKEVETFGYNKNNGYWGLSSKEFSQLLKSHGLTTPSGHYGLDSFFRDGSRTDLDTFIDVAHVTGQEYIIVPSLNESLIKTKDDFVRVGQKMNELATIVGKEGLKIGYHNHNFEWHPVEGTTFYDTLLKETDPKLVHMEMDIYWVVRAGHNPLEILNKHKGRFKFAHVKDSNKQNPNENEEIGKGGIDFKTIVPAAKAAGITHFIMEQENLSADPYASLAASASYMKKTLKV